MGYSFPKQYTSSIFVAGHWIKKKWKSLLLPINCYSYVESKEVVICKGWSQRYIQEKPRSQQFIYTGTCLISSAVPWTGTEGFPLTSPLVMASYSWKERKFIQTKKMFAPLGLEKKKRLKTFSLYFHLLQLNYHNLKKLKKIQVNLIWNHLYLKYILQELEQTREGGFNSKPSLYWKLCPLNLYFMYFVQYCHQY